MESRYRYSKDIVYNNFPWPDKLAEKQKRSIEQAAHLVLDARAEFPDMSLADLYDQLSMPRPLVRAHLSLDRAVDTAYGRKSFASDAERIAFLFELYQTYTTFLPSERKASKSKTKSKKPKKSAH